MTVANLARYVALLAAMFISFDTQRHLALSHGVSDVASYAVPVAIDLFLAWAVRSHRDIALAVGIAVSANVAGVLSAESLSAVSTWVGAALHAVFPLTVWRMHRAPQTAAGEAEATAPTDSLTVSAIATPAPAEPLRDSWPDADLWADFEDSEADNSPATPPTPQDVRAAIDVLASKHGRPVTGALLAQHYGVSERTGRRYLAMAGDA